MSEERILLVQCCHPTQFLYAARQLRRRHPNWHIDALVVDDPRNLDQLNTQDLDKIVRAGESSFAEGGRRLTGSGARYDRIAFVLLSPRYLKMRRLAFSCSRNSWVCDYSGNLERVGPARILLSAWRSPASPPVDFDDFCRGLPVSALKGKVLIVESCHPSLVAASKSTWKRFLDPQSETTRLKENSLEKGFLSTWRALRRQNFESAIVFFTSESGLGRLRSLPFLLGIPKIVVVDEGHASSLERPRALLRIYLRRILRPSPQPYQRPEVVVFQTESVPYTVHAVKKLQGPKLYPGAAFTLVCRNPDRDVLAAQLPDCRFISAPGRGLFSGLRLLRRASEISPDVVVATFSGRGVFRRYKLLYFLLNCRHHLVFNARLDAYPLRIGNLPRLFRRDALLYEEKEAPRYDRILLVQTDGEERMGRAFRKLGDPRVAAPSPVTILCREEDRAFYESVGADEVVSYAPGSLTGFFRALTQLRRLDVDAVAAVFSNRPNFRSAKLLFFLVPARHRLVFNGKLDCFYLNRGTWSFLLRRDFSPLKPVRRTYANTVLLIQTEEDSVLFASIETIRRPSVARTGRLLVFCRDDKGPAFHALPDVEDVITYRKGATWKNLRTCWRLRRLDLDMVAAVFSGRPIFRFQKLLFFLAPARHRLVINENLDCFYLTRRTLSRLLSLHGNRHWPLFRLLARTGLKGLVFVPRFFYLVIWITFLKLKRAYTLGKGEAPGR